MARSRALLSCTPMYVHSLSLFAVESYSPQDPETKTFGNRRTLVNPEDDPGAAFGFAVAISPNGQSVAVSAPFHDIDLGVAQLLSAGRAWVYSWGDPTATELDQSAPQFSGRFGFSLTCTFRFVHFQRVYLSVLNFSVFL